MALKNSQPRMRAFRSVPITLTTSFQPVDFSSTDPTQVFNYFANGADGNPGVYWDSVNKLFKFADKDINFATYLTGATTTNLLTIRAMLLYRFLIPNGNGVNNNYTFPNPGLLGYGVIQEVTSIASQQPFNITPPLYIEDKLKTNGVRLEVALSNSLISAGVSTVDYIGLLIQTSGNI